MVCAPHSHRFGSGSSPRSRTVAAPGVRRKFGAAALALSVAGFAAAGGPAVAQGPGCNPCNTFSIGPFNFPNPFAVPSYAPSTSTERARRATSDRGYSDRGSGQSSPHRRVASLSRSHESGHGQGAGDWTGGAVYVCVRTCDGSFFPLPYSGASGSTLDQICQALCPNAEMALFTMPFGGTIDQGVSPTGARYSAQPNAFKFQQTYEESCSCRRPGQSWADALSAAEAKYGHRAHELVVTEEASMEMSRPKPDPRAKASAPKAPAPNDVQPSDGPQPIAAAFSDPDLDVEGVDTKLKAATAAVSRETSGITYDDGATGSRFGLREGRIVRENDPDGGERRVRILAPLF